jgi:hypothetical protein
MERLNRISAGVAAMAALLLAPVAGLAQTPIVKTLTVKGLDGVEKRLSAQDLAAMPHEAVSFTIHGKTDDYSGVPVAALLALVGAPQGEALRGKAMTAVLIVTAADGYRVALSLAETDPAMRADPVIVADAVDGHPLGAEDGPFRLIVAGDKRAARAAREVQTLQLVAP